MQLVASYSIVVSLEDSKKREIPQPADGCRSDFSGICGRGELYAGGRCIALLINNKSIKPKRRTKKFRLRPKQHAHSLVMMDKQGIQTLTFMYKVRKYGDHLILK
ncbi:TPA: hypothetical protein MI534_05350 [Klebsiella pneumoniae]|nr:hypothetical protein [Klebsiella pneumoniae]EIW9259898.1 hypothetical protein [Klebsiella pneumoniae]EIW9313486.1 hypothetical protein [Klebsiella pneumoniae]OVV31432.1 hypothetical protein BME86_15180 [Klebsiella pneumoniae]OVY23341.1 hypothetical protein BME79_00020 [Klebsiella pneumoniae]